ncbi:MAG: hypothetical protein HY319_05240 [Armatimonadetes bacterium]|nr:hypothetical protein [Armatimonadota bacterium]
MKTSKTIVELKLRGLSAVLCYPVSQKEADRFRQALEDPGSGLFPLRTAHGMGAIVSLDDLLYVRTGELEGSVLVGVPDGIRVHLRGETGGVEFSMDEDSRDEISVLVDYLEDTQDVEAFIEWKEHGRRLVAVNLAQVMLFEYPLKWEKGG